MVFVDIEEVPDFAVFQSAILVQRLLCVSGVRKDSPNEVCCRHLCEHSDQLGPKLAVEVTISNIGVSCYQQLGT